MKYVIFDDKKIENFYPLTFTRATADLRVGILKLRQRLGVHLKFKPEALITKKLLKKIYRERHPEWQINELKNEETVLVNSRIIINEELKKKIENLELNSSLVKMDNIIAARIKSDKRELDSENLPKLFQSLQKIEVENAEFWEYTWELIAKNKQFIINDFEDIFYDKENKFDSEPGVTLLNPYDIWMGNDVELKPGVVLDASHGPIVIDDEAKLMPNAVITGPAYIGKKSNIKIGAKIYEGTTIGPVCKIGGEVEESIFQAYSNKQHDGFLGHSYLGEWVNLGADTNNSDLKNNYKTVKVYSYPLKKKIDSQQMFVGTVIGDHTKTGINCTINTGTVIGAASNLFGKDIIANHIPAFSWGEMNNLELYKPDKFFETAAIVKQRRNLSFSENEKELYRTIYDKERK